MPVDPQRTDEAAFGIAGALGLHPGPDASFKFADDLVGESIEGDVAELAAHDVFLSRAPKAD